jgi:hypothetical protein
MRLPHTLLAAHVNAGRYAEWRIGGLGARSQTSEELYLQCPPDPRLTKMQARRRPLVLQPLQLVGELPERGVLDMNRQLGSPFPVYEISMG